MKTRTCLYLLLLCGLHPLVGCGHGKAAATVVSVTTTSGDESTAADVPGAMDAPADADTIDLPSHVTRVTVYSDRARVTRTAVADVTDAPQVFAFRRLPGWVDDGSVRVAASAGRIVDVRVERDYLARSTDPDYLAAEEELRNLQEQMTAINDEMAVLDAQKLQIESIKAFSTEKIKQDTTIGNVTVDNYRDVMAFISDALRQTADARRKAQRDQEKLAPDVTAAERRMEDMRNLLSLEETTVLVTLQASRDTSSEVEVTYMMPGATWEPVHELRASTGGEKNVEVLSFAVVSQTSGEDWGTAELSFSTQSTVESVRIPELEALTLGDTQTARRIVTTKESSFSRAQKAFEGQSRLWNKVHQSTYMEKEQTDFEQVYESNMAYLQVVQSKTVEIFESLKNRGTSAHFKAAALYDVRGDGHPTRVRIGHSNLSSKHRIVAAPEQSLNAVRTLDMVNSTGQALLPGKVSLYQDGAFIGVTDLDFIAQNESFSVFLGVADHLKLSRQFDKKQSSLVHRQQSRMTVAFAVTVENLSADATQLVLADRIPVSQNREIKVSNVKINPATTPDSQGILRWSLDLKPGEKKEFRIAYQVDYPSELLIETRRRRFDTNTNMYPPAEIQGNSPVHYMPRKKAIENYDIQEQLVDLEEML